MKNLTYSFIIIFSFIQCSYGAKVGDYVKIAQNSKSDSKVLDINSNSVNKILKETMSSVQEDVMKQLNTEISKVQENLQGNVDKVLNKFDSQIQETVDRVNNNIIGKAEKLVNDATNEYNNLIKTKNNIISMVEKIINNLPSYMLIAKIVGCAILLIIVLLIFLFWKSFKRAKGMLDSIRNVDTKELNKKLEEINLKLDKILSRNE